MALALTPAVALALAATTMAVAAMPILLLQLSAAVVRACVAASAARVIVVRQ